MTNQQLTSVLTVEPYGFILSPHDLYFDRDKPCPPYVVCLERKHPQTSVYQYLTLTEYDGKFVEATFFVYSQPFNSKAKVNQRQTPLVARLLRSFDEIVKAIS